MGIIGVDLDNTMFTCKRSFSYMLMNKFQFLRSDDKLKYKEIDTNEAKEVHPIIKNFHKILNPASYKAYPEAIETINALYDQGYQIYIITSRPAISPIVSATVAWLKENGVKFDKLIMGCNNKGEYAKQNKVSLIIDDFDKTCKSLDKRGIDSILFKGTLKSKKKFTINKKTPHITIMHSWNTIKEHIGECISKIGEVVEETGRILVDQQNQSQEI